jgi:hypothetical protein
MDDAAGARRQLRAATANCRLAAARPVPAIHSIKNAAGIAAFSLQGPVEIISKPTS